MEPLIKFCCKVGEKRFEEVMTYNRMLQWCDQHKDSGEFYRLVEINRHRKLKNGKYQVRVLWASGLRDWRDTDVIFEDDRVTLAAYARKNRLLELPGWQRLKRYATRVKVITRMINQVRLKNYWNRPHYKYGFQVPRDHDEAVMIDEREGNTKWQDSEQLEVPNCTNMTPSRVSGLEQKFPKDTRRYRVISYTTSNMTEDTNQEWSPEGIVQILP